MILRTLSVEGWRCFANRVKLGPFAEGLNVVHGPNGSGKSTMLWALVRGLFDKYNSIASDIKSLAPWGRPLNPKVCIEFAHSGTEYRLTKQFLGSALSEVERVENGRFQRLAESTQADDFARNLLSAEAAHGASKSEHWGFAQVLWAMQGELQIDKLSDGTRNTIQAALGAQLAGHGTEGVERRIRELYSSVFTASGKGYRTGRNAPAILGLRENLLAAEAKLPQLRDRLAQFDEASRRIEDLKRRVEQSAVEERDLAQRSQQATERAAAYETLDQQRTLQEQIVHNAQQEYQRISDKIVEIARQLSELKRKSGALNALLAQRPAQEKIVTQCDDSVHACSRQVEDLRRKRTLAAQAKDVATEAERYLRVVKEIAGRHELIEEIKEEQSRLDKATRSRTGILAPDDKLLKAVRAALKRRDKAQIELDAAMITVTIEPHVAVRAKVIAAEQAQDRDASSGQAFVLRGAPEVAFELEGVATIRASGPTGSVDELRDAIRAANRDVVELTEGFGTQDVEALEQLRAAAASWDAKIDASRTRVNDLCRDTSLEQIEVDQAQARNALEAMLSRQPVWRDSPPDADALRREADYTTTQVESDLNAAETEFAKAQHAKANADKKWTELETNVKNAQTAQTESEDRIKELTSDGLSEPEREQAQKQAALAHHGAAARLAEVQGMLAEFPGDPREEAKTLASQRDSCREETQRSKEKLVAAETALETILVDAPYSQLAVAEEEVQRLREDVAREELHCKAVKLLYETIVDRKSRVINSLIGPVRTRAQRTLQRIAGSRFEAIEFDESFRPQAITPAVHNEPVAISYLSGGEKEQVHFAVRLALADVAFGEERELVVLDDAFTATDPSRLARIIQILDEASDRFQIVLLSCHPERYLHLKSAKFFDLPMLVESGG